MNAWKPAFLIIIGITYILILGCSGSSPIVPENKPMTLNEIPIIITTSGSDFFDASGLMGAYELTIDAKNIKADLITKRIGSIGESYIVNGISYFTIAPCSDCLKIKSMALTSDNLLQLTFAIKHPFEAGDIYQPPSGRNRLDLDIFDVALLVRPIDATPTSFSLTNASAYTGVLVRNAGYTTEISNVIDDNTALPFVLVIDDNKAGANTYNEFPMGAEAEFDVFFNISKNLIFELYLTMGYGASAKKANRLVPTYFNPEFNRKNAWKVSVTPPQGGDAPSLLNTWNDTNNLMSFEVKVEVFDWQIGANVNPEMAESTDVYASSEVSSVSLEIPGMSNSLMELTTPDSGSGAPNDPLRYTFSLANENLLGAGEYTGLVKVNDERIPGEVVAGGETDTMVSSPNGIQIEWVEIPEFATYQTFTATVIEAPVFVIETPNGGEQWPIATDQDITWSGGDGLTTVKLEYSKDDFAVDIHEIIPSTENDGLFTWEIPDDESDTVKVRISSTDFSWISDVSDDYFSIEESFQECIVYTGESMSPYAQVYSIDPLGVGPPEQWTLCTDMFVEGAKLSPDGTKIIYMAGGLSGGFYADLRIIDVATGVETDITPSGQDALHGDFQNLGTKIVAAMGLFGYPLDLYTVNYDGSELTQLTTGADVWAPQYSSDDTKITYQQFANGQVYIYDVATGLSTQYTFNSTYNDDPHFSPSGTQIAWATMYGMGGGRNIYVSPISSWYPPDYQMAFESYIRAPCFSPDGTKIAFDHGGGNSAEIAVYTISTGTWQNITSNGWGDYQADWGYIIPH